MKTPCFPSIFAGLIIFLVSAIPKEAYSALYWFHNVQSSPVSLCFVGSAVSSRGDRVNQILTYIKEFEYVANIQFVQVTPGTWSCPAPVMQPDGTDFHDGDVRVVLTGTDISTTGLIPGAGCTFESPGSSWSNPPDEVETKRACLYNLKLGDDGDSSGTPWLNHTLHEFGHALGLSHEHVRWDVEEHWAKYYLNKISGVTDADAQAIYDSGFRTACELAVSDEQIPILQQIQGYETYSAAKQLRDDAKDAVTNPKTTSCYGGQAKDGFITPYDRDSVMHYKFADAGINGNYDHTGLSTWDKLALHILYPEANKAAEFVGRTVLRSGEHLQLQSAWLRRGANINYVANNFAWRINGIVMSNGPTLSVQLQNPGTYSMQFTYSDFLGRNYAYNGPVRVLSDAEYDAQRAAIEGAQINLWAERKIAMTAPDHIWSSSYEALQNPVNSTDPIKTKPLGIGSLAVGGDMLNLKIGLSQTSAPVDVYVAYIMRKAPQTINILNPDRSISTFTVNEIVNAVSTGARPMGFQPWVPNTVGPIVADLFDIPIRSLPEDTYTVFVLLTQQGALNNYYLWSTSFAIP